MVNLVRGTVQSTWSVVYLVSGEVGRFRPLDSHKTRTTSGGGFSFFGKEEGGGGAPQVFLLVTSRDGWERSWSVVLIFLKLVCPDL